MPEQTETLTQKPEEVVVEDKGPDSGTESESDDSIPELEDTGAGGAGEGRWGFEHIHKKAKTGGSPRH